MKLKNNGFITKQRMFRVPWGVPLHCKEHWQAFVNLLLGGASFEFKINQKVSLMFSILETNAIGLIFMQTFLSKKIKIK